MDDMRKKLLEEFRLRYESEVSRKADLNSRLGIILGVFSVLLAGGVTFVKDAPTSGHWALLVWFWLPVAGSAVLSCLVLNNLRKFLFGFTYGYVSDPQSIDSHLVAVEKYNNDPLVGQKLDVNDEIDALLYEQYRDLATQFSENNHLRTIYLYDTFRLVFMIVVGYSLAVIPYLVLCPINPHVQQVQVIKSHP